MKSITKIIKIILVIIRDRNFFKFKIPKSNLVLVDNITVDHLRTTVISDFDFIPISTRIFGEAKDRNNVENTFYLNPKLILFFIIGLFKKLNFKNSYVFACIKYINPKLVLHNTHDHNLIFIAQLLPKINFLILSHGQWYEHTKTGKSLENTTMLYDLAKTKVKKLSNFYIFLPGEKDVELFNKVGVNKYNDKIKIEAIGSYEASYYNSVNFLKSKSIRQDLLFVSQLYDDFFNLEDELSKLYIKETAEALKLLSRYASENNLSLSFLCRNNPENDKREIDYVKSIIKDASKIKILKNIAKPLWKEIFASGIVATIDSTVGFDTISIKKKTLLMPLGFTNTKTFTVDENSLLNNIWKWTIINNDYENFRLSLNELIEINELKYEKSIQKDLNYWFNDQNQLPAFQYVQKFIRNKLI